ncbi:hypothetical protein [Aquimarina sp. MMG016]|uniref:hypothetical protein n=1 Tax=Aquimarina sp. MMG016 TaxID=2822690 RepID=UPI001B3A60D1|nr:hypothetical protein [Aquimarina sp. MMG016]MBQ4818878.1 hypothetical protein [Aquimarina sp. MMG016]
MEARNRKPGSVRLNELQYAEMDRLGFTNESAYVKYKMDQGQSKLEGLKTSFEKDMVRQLPVTNTSQEVNPVVKDQLTIQRLSMENRKLQEKLEEISKSSEETLNGVHHKVHTMLQEELQKRDYEQLKKSYAESESKVKKLQEGLDEAQKEIEALVKKLGFVELGKALLPGAISGLAKQYPNQMKGIAGTLGRLGISDTPENTNDHQENNYLLQVLEHLSEVFTEEQFEQVIQLMIQLGEQINDDQGLIQKITYYLSQLKRKTEAKKNGNKEAE